MGEHNHLYQKKHLEIFERNDMLPLRKCLRSVCGDISRRDRIDPYGVVVNGQIYNVVMNIRNDEQVNEYLQKNPTLNWRKIRSFFCERPIADAPVLIEIRQGEQSTTTSEIVNSEIPSTADTDEDIDYDEESESLEAAVNRAEGMKTAKRKRRFPKTSTESTAKTTESDAAFKSENDIREGLIEHLLWLEANRQAKNMFPAEVYFPPEATCIELCNTLPIFKAFIDNEESIRPAFNAEGGCCMDDCKNSEIFTVLSCPVEFSKSKCNHCMCKRCWNNCATTQSRKRKGGPLIRRLRFRCPLCEANIATNDFLEYPIVNQPVYVPMEDQVMLLNR
jgi:hypothetical protein